MDINNITPRYFPSRNSQRFTGRAITARIVPVFISLATELAAHQAANKLPVPLTKNMMAETIPRTMTSACEALPALAIAFAPNSGVIISSTVQAKSTANTMSRRSRRKPPKVLSAFSKIFIPAPGRADELHVQILERRAHGHEAHDV